MEEPITPTTTASGQGPAKARPAKYAKVLKTPIESSSPPMVKRPSAKCLSRRRRWPGSSSGTNSVEMDNSPWLVVRQLQPLQGVKADGRTGRP